MTYEYDRGAFPALTFNRCARGFTLRASDPTRDYLIAPTFAFDRIEDVAVWLVEQYRDSGSGPEGENSRSEVEGEAPQSGGEAASPKCPDQTPPPRKSA